MAMIFFFAAYEIKSTFESWQPAPVYFVMFTLLGILMVLKALRYKGRMFTTNERKVLLYTTLTITGFMLVIVVGTLHEIVGPSARFNWQTYIIEEWAPAPGLIFDFFLLFYIFSVAKGDVTSENSSIEVTQNDREKSYNSRAFLQLLPFILTALFLFFWTYDIQIIPIIGVVPIISLMIGIYLNRHALAAILRRIRSPSKELKPSPPLKITLTLHCPKCGTELSTDAEFCPQCRTKLPPRNPI